MTRAVPFTQAFVERAIKAARKQGLRVSGMTVRPDGAITIHAAEERRDVLDAAITARSVTP
jgi:hypothetical protein